jgi:hypothetical protein
VVPADADNKVDVVTFLELKVPDVLKEAVAAGTRALLARCSGTGLHGLEECNVLDHDGVLVGVLPKKPIAEVSSCYARS